MEYNIKSNGSKNRKPKVGEFVKESGGRYYLVIKIEDNESEFFGYLDIEHNRVMSFRYSSLDDLWKDNSNDIVVDYELSFSE